MIFTLTNKIIILEGQLETLPNQVIILEGQWQTIDFMAENDVYLNVGERPFETNNQVQCFISMFSKKTDRPVGTNNAGGWIARLDLQGKLQ